MRARVGLVGCGRWGRLILRDLLTCGAEVHVVDKRHPEPGIGAHAWSGDLASTFGLDGVIVATPASTHAEIVETLLRAGRPIFVEKPMTTDIVSARRLAEAAPQNLFVMDKWRYHPGVRAIRAEIDAGRCGAIVAIRTTRWQWGHAHSDVSPLWTLAAHDLAIVRHVLGALPPLTHASALRLGGELVGFVAEMRGVCGPSIVLDIGVASPKRQRRCLVIGARATLELRGDSENCVFARDGAPGRLDAAEREIRLSARRRCLPSSRRFSAISRAGRRPLATHATASRRSSAWRR